MKIKVLKWRFKKTQFFIIIGIKKLIYKISPFFWQFFGNKWFWNVKSTYSEGKIKVSYEFFKEIIFLKINLEVQSSIHKHAICTFT